MNAVTLHTTVILIIYVLTQLVASHVHVVLDMSGVDLLVQVYKYKILYTHTCTQTCKHTCTHKNTHIHTCTHTLMHPLGDVSFSFTYCKISIIYFYQIYKVFKLRKLSEPYIHIYMYTLFADKNECGDSTHNCHADATCTNTAGSFTCACNEGFQGDGTNCTGEPVQDYFLPVSIF